MKKKNSIKIYLASAVMLLMASPAFAQKYKVAKVDVHIQDVVFDELPVKAEPSPEQQSAAESADDGVSAKA